MGDMIGDESALLRFKERVLTFDDSGAGPKAVSENFTCVFMS
jgi:hypothetical protein